MTKNIMQKVSIKKSIRVNRDLLINLQSLLSSYAAVDNTIIKVLCEDNSEYKFDSFSEFLQYKENLPKRVSVLTIDILFVGKEYGSFSIEFRNDLLAWVSGSVDIAFCFHDEDNYFLLKNKLIQLLNNYQAPYSIITRLNLTVIVSILVFAFICIYTNYKNIIFQTPIQYLIGFGIVAIDFISYSCDGFRKLKHKIFPYCEFFIWSNTAEKYRNIRNILGVSVVLAILVGVITNFISALF